MKKKTFLFFAIDVRLKRQSISAAIFGGLTLSSGWPFFSVIDLVHNSYKQSHQLNPWGNKLQWIALNEIAHPCLDLVWLCVNAGVKFGKDLLMVAKKNVWHQFTPSPFNPPPYPSSLTCTSLAMMFMIPPTPSCTGFLYCTLTCAVIWFIVLRLLSTGLLWRDSMTTVWEGLLNHHKEGSWFINKLSAPTCVITKSFYC